MDKTIKKQLRNKPGSKLEENSNTKRSYYLTCLSANNKNNFFKFAFFYLKNYKKFVTKLTIK